MRLISVCCGLILSLIWTLPATAAPLYTAVAEINNLGCFRCGDRKVREEADRPVKAEATGEFNGGQAEARATAGSGILGAFGSAQNQGPQGVPTLFSAIAVDEVDDLFFSSPPGSAVEEASTRLNMHLDGVFGFNAATDDQQTAWVRVEFTHPGSANSWGFIEIVRRDGGTTEINRENLLANVQVIDETDPSGDFERVIRIDANIRTPVFVVPMNVPINLGIAITTGGQQWSSLGLGSVTADFEHTLSFPKDRPVFDLPAGYTVNSTAFGIVDNQYVVPEPATAVLLGLAVIGGLAGRARARWRQGHSNSRFPFWLGCHNRGCRYWSRVVMLFNMNDNGDIAFRYVSANASFGIAVANVVPKPSSAILLEVGLFVVQWSNARRHAYAGTNQALSRP